MPVFGPLGASVTVNVTSATQTFALPALPGSLPAVRLVGRQANQVAWYIKFGTGATTVSRTDGKRVDVGSIDFPLILGVPAGATHIAILCEGPPGDVTITSGGLILEDVESFAPLGASQIVGVTQTDQTIALPAMGSANPAIQLVGTQANMVSLFLKFGTGAVVGDRDTSMQVRPGAIAAPTIVGVPSGATHLSIFCEGSPGGVILTPGNLPIGVGEPGGAIVSIEQGGTDASTAAGALANLGAMGQGKHTIWVPAVAMGPRTTAGPAIVTVELPTNDIMLRTLDFDQTTEEGAQFQVAMPKSWNGGSISYIPYWTAATGAGTVFWAVTMRAFNNDDALDQSLAGATGADSSDTLIAANDLHLGPESNAITPEGTPGDDSLLIVQIRRVTGLDTLTADAKLIGVKLFYTINAANDA